VVGTSVTGIQSYKSVTSGNKQSRNAMSGFKLSAVRLYWVNPLECVVSDLERLWACLCGELCRNHNSERDSPWSRPKAIYVRLRRRCLFWWCTKLCFL